MTIRVFRAIGLIAACACVFGCETSPPAAGHAARIVGKWVPPEDAGETIEFFADGTWVGRSQRGDADSGGHWSIERDTLRFEYKSVKGQRAGKDETIQYRIESIDAKLMHLAMPSGYVGEWKRVR